MIAKRAADAIVIAGTGEQGIDLLHRRLRPAEPQLEHPLHRHGQILCPLQLPLDRALIQLLQRAAVLLQPRQQLSDLVDPGDGAAGDLGELSIDLRCRRLSNLAAGFGEDAINTEAALVDDGSSAPRSPAPSATAAAAAYRSRARLRHPAGNIHTSRSSRS